jgi:hypothetical protein
MSVNPNYRTVDRDDFSAMMVNGRYFERSNAFENIIARTDEHFWNPEDPAYINLLNPPPLEGSILPEQFLIEPRTAVWDRLDEKQRMEFMHDSACWTISQLLHGEQGALSLSSWLCDIFLDPGAQEYAANQVREEARHVHAFTLYMQARFDGKIMAPGDTLGGLLKQIVASPIVYQKIVGMQMLVEGLAMGAFTTLYQESNDPLLRRLCQLIMTDEAFHHKFGKIWAHETVPNLPEAEHNAVEDWAEECFQLLLFNLVSPEQRRALYPKYGLDWEWVQGAMAEAVTDDERRERMMEGNDIFRTLIKTLDNAGIITDRTRATYGNWVDMAALRAEGDSLIGYDVAEAGIKDLQAINAGKRKIVQKVSA